MIQLVADEEGRCITICMAGVINAADLDDADERINQSDSGVGAQRILLDWTQLEGWEKGAKTVGTWVGMRHWANVVKIAILADPKWEDETLRIADIYKVADVQRFDLDDRPAATDWLNEA